MFHLDLPGSFSCYIENLCFFDDAAQCSYSDIHVTYTDTLTCTDIGTLLRILCQIYRGWLFAGILAFSVVAVIIAYLSVWLPFKGVTLEFNVSAPKAIPLASLFSVLGSIFFNLALWRSYGFLTPLFLGILFIAGLMSCHFVPSVSCACCCK